MRKIFIFLLVGAAVLLAGFSMAGCTDGKPVRDVGAVDSTQTDSADVDSVEEAIDESPMPKAADELFDDFIFNFAANRKLQMSRIVFPLPVVRDGKEVERIQKSHWRMENFFMRQGYYTLIFDNMRQMELVKDTAVGHAVIEYVTFETKTVKQYIFDRQDGLWMLTRIVYVPTYRNMNASFLEFYEKFSADKEFQIASMASEVAFTCPDPDDDFEQMTGTFMPEQWPAFAPDLLPSGSIWNILYGQEYTESTQKIFVLRGIANGLEAELTFRRVGKSWKLVKLNT